MSELHERNPDAAERICAAHGADFDTVTVLVHGRDATEQELSAILSDIKAQ